MYCLLYGLWWGFLRRWFGGLFPDEQYKILGNRGLQTIVMLLSIFPVSYILCQNNYPQFSIIVNVILASCITAWSQFQFWSRGHGSTFADMGRNKNPDLSRYDRWFKIPLDYCWNKLLYLKQNNKFFNWLLQRWSGTMYGYTYDMTYHTLRYTLCMVPVSLILLSWSFIIIGLLSAPIYELNIRFYEKKHYSFMDLPYLNTPNKLSEIIYGFVFGSIFYGNLL